jgi:PAS domain S-box-containing protein
MIPIFPAGGRRMRAITLDRWRAYSLAIVFVAVATGIRCVFDPILGAQAPYATYIVAIIVTGGYCGFGPSILCLLLSVLAAEYFFVPPRGSVLVGGVPSLVSAGLFFLMSIPMLVVFEMLRSSRRDAETRAEHLARVEAELRRDKRLLLLVLDSMAEGVAVCDRDGTFILGNAAAKRITGRIEPVSTVQECMRLIRHFRVDGITPVPDDDLPLSRALRGEISAEREMVVQFPACAGPQVLAVTASPLLGEAGALEGAVAVFRDITGQKKAEESIRESEERFHAFMDNGPVFAWIKDAEGKYVYQNRSHQEIVNSAPLRMIGKTDFEVWPGELAEIYRCNDLRAIAAGAPIETLEEARVVGQPARTWWTSKFPMETARGATLVGGIAIDITERLQAQAALAESESRFRSVFEHSPAGMVIADMEDRLLQVNNAFCRLVGRTREELRSLTMHDLTHPDDRSRRSEFIRKALAGESPGIVKEKRYVRPDGQIVWAKVSAGLVRDEAGKPLYFVGQVQDITRQRQDQELVRQALAEKEVLLGEIHHRVKNNLQVVASLLYLQSKQPMEPSSARLFLDSRERVLSMAMVHEQLYRSDNYSTVDFATYLRDLASHLLETYKVNGQAITLQFALDRVRLRMDDAVQLGLIVNELISNALQHAFPAGRSGTLGIRAGSSDGKVTVEVNDDGVGLPCDLTLERGGFGLKTVTGIVGHLDGLLELDRQGGTTFRVTLPLSSARRTKGARPWPLRR